MIIENEEVIAICRRHWLNYIISGAITAFFAIGAIVDVLLWAIYDQEFELYPFLMCIAFVLIVVLLIHIDHKYTYLALTKTRLIGRKGVIWPSILSIPRSRPYNINLTYVTFGCYTVTIEDGFTGKVEFRLKCMAKAKSFVAATRNR